MTQKANRTRVGVAFLSFIVLGLRAGILGVTWPAMRDTFSVSLDAVGVLMFAGLISYLLTSFYSGRIIRQVGLGTYLMWGGIIAGVGFAGHALAPSWWLFIFVGFVSAFGTAAVDAGLNTYFAANRNVSVMNWMHACFGLGATISPIMIAAILTRGYTWRWGYVVFAIGYGILALCFALTNQAWRLGAQAQADASPPLLSSLDTLKLPIVWLNLLLFFTFTGMEGTTGQWPYTLFTEGRGIDSTVVSSWVSIFWMSMTAGRILFGFVVKAVKTKPLIRACMGSTICGAFLIWWNPSDLASFLGLGLMGFTLAPLFPVLTSTTSDRLGDAHAANAVGFQMAFSRLGLASVPALAGVLAEAWRVEIIAPFMLINAVLMMTFFEVTMLVPSPLNESGE